MDPTLLQHRAARWLLDATNVWKLHALAKASWNAASCAGIEAGKLAEICSAHVDLATTLRDVTKPAPHGLRESAHTLLDGLGQALRECSDNLKHWQTPVIPPGVPTSDRHSQGEIDVLMVEIMGRLGEQDHSVIVAGHLFSHAYRAAYDFLRQAVDASAEWWAAVSLLKRLNAGTAVRAKVLPITSIDRSLFFARLDRQTAVLRNQCLGINRHSIRPGPALEPAALLPPAPQLPLPSTLAGPPTNLTEALLAGLTKPVATLRPKAYLEESSGDDIPAKAPSRTSFGRDPSKFWIANEGKRVFWRGEWIEFSNERQIRIFWAMWNALRTGKGPLGSNDFALALKGLTTAARVRIDHEFRGPETITSDGTREHLNEHDAWKKGLIKLVKRGQYTLDIRPDEYPSDQFGVEPTPKK